MFQDRIKQLRLKNKLTQQEVADKLGVTRPAYTAYETGKRQPDFDTLAELSALFDVSTDYLLGKDSVPNRELGAKGSLVATHIDDDASDEDIEDILNYIEMRRKNPLGKK